MKAIRFEQEPCDRTARIPSAVDPVGRHVYHQEYQTLAGNHARKWAHRRPSYWPGQLVESANVEAE